MATTIPVRELPPPPKGLPIIGRSLEYARDPVALFHKQWDAYGAVSPMSMVGTDQWAMLLGPMPARWRCATPTRPSRTGRPGPSWSARSSGAG